MEQQAARVLKRHAYCICSYGPITNVTPCADLRWAPAATPARLPQCRPDSQRLPPFSRKKIIKGGRRRKNNDVIFPCPPPHIHKHNTLSIDIAASFEGRRIAFEVDGPFHFMVNRWAGGLVVGYGWRVWWRVLLGMMEVDGPYHFMVNRWAGGLVVGNDWRHGGGCGWRVGMADGGKAALCAAACGPGHLSSSWGLGLQIGEHQTASPAM